MIEETDVGPLRQAVDFLHVAIVKKRASFKIGLENERSWKLMNVRVRWAFLLDNSQVLKGERICSLAPQQRLTFVTEPSEWDGTLSKSFVWIPWGPGDWRVPQLQGRVVEVVIDDKTVARQSEPPDVWQKAH
jgi:hypothetical protein